MWVVKRRAIGYEEKCERKSEGKQKKRNIGGCDWRLAIGKWHLGCGALGSQRSSVLPSGNCKCTDSAHSVADCDVH